MCRYMIAKMFKWVFPVVVLLSPHNAMSQAYKNPYSHKGNKILYDMEGRTLWADSLGYITLEGDILAVSDLQPVYFDKGKDGFSNYIDSCYYNGPAYNHDEFQFSITFHLIFKEDMNIEEVRLAAPSSSKITPELRSYFVDCVFKTNGRWRSAEKAHGTYAYVQTCTFY